MTVLTIGSSSVGTTPAAGTVELGCCEQWA